MQVAFEYSRPEPHDYGSLVSLESNTECILKGVDLLSPPMAREVHYNELTDLLEELDYPVSREEAAETMSDVTLLLADGERNLGELVSRTSSDKFVAVDDVFTELQSTLPREAVGEPYQSEGEG